MENSQKEGLALDLKEIEKLISLAKRNDVKRQLLEFKTWITKQIEEFDKTPNNKENKISTFENRINPYEIISNFKIIEDEDSIK